MFGYQSSAEWAVPVFVCLLTLQLFAPTDVKLRAWSTGHEVPYKVQPRKIGSQHRELRALLFTNSVWDL